MAEYKYTIEVTLRSEVPKSNVTNVPAQANVVGELMPLLLNALKNVQVKNVSSEKEVEKK